MERSMACAVVYTKPTGIALRLFAPGLPSGVLHRGVVRRLRGVRRVRPGVAPIGVFLGLERLRVLTGFDVLRCDEAVRFLLTRLRPVRVIRVFLTVGR
jgi:hypothetical protein